MIVDRNIRPYVIEVWAPLHAALRKVNENQGRIIFCVDEHGLLKGVLSDGDFRRWVVDQREIDLDRSVSTAMNPSPILAHVDDDQAAVARRFSQSIDQVPLVDARGRLVAVARRRDPAITIGGRVIDKDSPAFLVAEIGLNHNGDLELATQLVREAAAAGAECAKFQMRDLNSLYRNEGDPNDAREDLGAQYTLDLLSRFALSIDDLFRLFDLCRSHGMAPLCTPWDHASIDALERYGIEAYKVASADLTNHPLVSSVAATGKPVIASTGMSTESEIEEVVGVLKSNNATYALLHCNSSYPAPFKDVNLRYLSRLATIGECIIGYSGHERGHEVTIAAVALGARIIEKHFTADRSMEGNDHKVSLLPEEFAAMVRAIRNVEESLGNATSARVITQGEMMNRVSLAKSLVATKDIPAGATITSDAVDIKSPGRGLQPNRREDLVGRVAHRSVSAGDFFFESDLRDREVTARDYHFNRPWGLPVRYHDYKALLAASNPDFLEFHMTYKDMEESLDTYFPVPVRCRLAVHSPDLFAGDHILDLAAEDDDYRKRSINELQRAIDLTRELSERFEGGGEPVIVASLGGFTENAPVLRGDRSRLYDRVADSLDQLDEEGVLLLGQTLPPLPWYRGGQLYCNLFVDAEDTAEFCRTANRQLCLDVSHTKLAANVAKRPFSEVIDILAPLAAHVHLVDAAGVDGEGFQVGEGEIDFAVLAKQLEEHCPEAGFIPEIWMGHRNNGEGFWVALERLEQWF